MGQSPLCNTVDGAVAGGGALASATYATDGAKAKLKVEKGFRGRREVSMKGNEKIIETLNARLTDELTAINQYIVHSEMCANWGYERLHDAIEKRAIQEMHHAEKLIARIIFLEGRPMVSNLNTVSIGSDVEAQLRNDWAAEEGAIKAYNEDIRLAAEIGDNGTRDLLESILMEEEAHIDWIEAQLDQIEQMGIQNYLVEQLG